MYSQALTYVHLHARFSRKYNTYRDSILALEDPVLSALVPDMDDETRTGGIAGRFPALLRCFSTFNGTDHDFLMECTKKSGVKFGSGWDSVWENLGGYPNRVNK